MEKGEEERQGIGESKRVGSEEFRESTSGCSPLKAVRQPVQADVLHPQYMWQNDALQI